MSFVAPTWDSSNCQYIIELLPAYSDKTRTSIKKDVNGSTVFADADFVENATDAVVHNLIEEGSSNNWFTKLPSHEQLMKRVKHVFKTLAQESQNVAVVTSLLLTPKQISFVWEPSVFANSVLPFSFDDSDSDSAGEEVDLPESNLPPVKLTDDSQQSHEEYLLTRLRAAKARVEAEQIRMQYFEATGRMPPDSESEDE
jgi:hypothetical protein